MNAQQALADEIRAFHLGKTDSLSLQTARVQHIVRIKDAGVLVSSGVWVEMPSVLRLMRRWKKLDDNKGGAQCFRWRRAGDAARWVTIAPCGTTVVGCTVLHHTTMRVLYSDLAQLGHFGKRQRRLHS
jgi:hypothetical protein